MPEEKNDENRKLNVVEKLEKDVKTYFYKNKSINIIIIKVIIAFVSFLFISIIKDHYIFYTNDIKEIIKNNSFLIVAYLIYIALLILIRNHKLLKYIAYKQMTKEEKEELFNGENKSE